MKSGYSYYIFDEEDFGNINSGELKVKISGVRTDINEPEMGAVPEGGFQNLYYACEIVK